MIYEPVDPAVYLSRPNDPNFISGPAKKIILADLARIIIDDITTKGNMPNFARLTSQALNNKNLIIYFPDLTAQTSATSFNWTGTLPQNENFCMAVDANLGSKLDFMIEKNLVVKQISANKYQATLTYHNNLKPGEKRLGQPFIVYRSFVRLFVPEGSSLTNASGGQNMIQTINDSKTKTTAFSSLVVLEPGQTETIVFTWTVPEGLDNKPINVLKQPGSHMQSKAF